MRYDEFLHTWNIEKFRPIFKEKTGIIELISDIRSLTYIMCDFLSIELKILLILNTFLCEINGKDVIKKPIQNPWNSLKSFGLFLEVYTAVRRVEFLFQS